MKAQYFIKSIRPSPLDKIILELNEFGSIKKDSLSIASLDLEYKYQIIRLASMGFLKFDKGILALNDKHHGNIDSAHIH